MSPQSDPGAAVAEAVAADVRGYVADFFPGSRAWLDEAVDRFVHSVDGRRLVIIGAPGVGKSTYAAHLATRYGSLAYFSRAKGDPVGELARTDPKTFLLSIGWQLRERYGSEIFGGDLVIKGQSHVGTAGDRAEAVGTDVDAAFVLPFRQLMIEGLARVHEAKDDARVRGVRIRELHDSLAAASVADVLRESITLPLEALRRRSPEEVVVLVVDGLDATSDVVSSLARPDAGRGATTLVDALPVADNLRVIATSRPGRIVARFRPEERIALSETREVESSDRSRYFVARNRDDVRRYVVHVVRTDQTIRRAMDARSESRYVRTVVARSGGNFLYLRHYFDALRADLGAGGTELLDVERVPRGLTSLYRVLLLERIKGGMPQEQWRAQYAPILGVLAVARDALPRASLARFARVDRMDVDEVVGALGEFLDTTMRDDLSHYRIYHASFAEFLSDEKLNPDYPLDADRFHGQIVSVYAGDGGMPGGGRWSEVDDYGRAHLAAHAAFVGRFDELLASARFLVTAFPSSVVPRLYAAATLAGRRAAEAYRRIADQLVHVEPDERLSRIWLSALQVGANGLARDCRHTAASRGRPAQWQPAWAWWRRPTPSRRIAQLPGVARDLAVISTDDGPIVVLVGDTFLESRHLETGEVHGLAMTPEPGGCVVVTAIEGDPYVVVGHDDGSITSHALPSMLEVARAQAGAKVLGMAVSVDGAFAISGTFTGRLESWRLPLLEPIASTEPHTMVRAVVAGTLAGAPVVVSAGDTLESDGRRRQDKAPIRVSSVPDLTLIAETSQDRDIVQAVGYVSRGTAGLILEPGLEGIKVIVVGSNGHIEACGSAGGIHAGDRFLPLVDGGDAADVLVIDGLVRRLRIFGPPCPVEVAVGEAVEAEYGSWAGPLPVHERPTLVSARRALTLWDLEELTAETTTAEPGGLVARQLAHGIEHIAVAGDVLAATTSDRSLHRWRARSGDVVGESPPVIRAVDLAAIPANGRHRLITARSDRGVDVIDAETGERVAKELLPDMTVSALAAVARNRKPVVACAGELGTEPDLFGHPRPYYGIRLLDVDTGREIDTRRQMFGIDERDPLSWKLAAPGGTRDKPFSHLTAFDDGARLLLAAASSRQLMVWALPGGDDVFSMARRYAATAVGGGSGLLAVAELGDQVAVWRTDDWSATSIPVRGTNAILVADWVGHRSLVLGTDDGWVTVWTPDGERRAAIEVDAPVTSLGFLAPSTVAVGTRMGVVALTIPNLSASA